MSDVQLYHGDCLEIMPKLPAQSVQMVFADLPYAIKKHKCTNLEWDIPFDIASFTRIVKKVITHKSPLIMTANMRFAAHLISASCVPFRYDLIWQKTRFSGFLNAKKMPLRAHENILLFYKSPPVFNPVMRKNISGRSGSFNQSGVWTKIYGEKKGKPLHVLGAPLQPISVFSVTHPNKERGLHPTQKPIALLEWLIRTYTNPGDTVLDPVAGSGTTAIAAMRTGRKVICIEKDATYFAAMQKRVADERVKMHQQSLISDPAPPVSGHTPAPPASVPSL